MTGTALVPEGTVRDWIRTLMDFHWNEQQKADALAYWKLLNPGFFEKPTSKKLGEEAQSLFEQRVFDKCGGLACAPDQPCSCRTWAIERKAFLDSDNLDDEPPGPCTGACEGMAGKNWVCSGTAYGGDDASYHGDGRCYCVHCGADGDG